MGEVVTPPTQLSITFHFHFYQLDLIYSFFFMAAPLPGEIILDSTTGLSIAYAEGELTF